MTDLISWQSVTTPLQILLVDLLLGADNALVIGLASRGLPAAQRKRAAALGVSGAVALRLSMTMVAGAVLAAPLVKLIGAILLMAIALNLSGDEDEIADLFAAEDGGVAAFWRTAALIVVADAVMSLDNVVALAAIAQGNLLWLLIGVMLSLPLLGYGGLVIAESLHKAPGLVALGAALLGWIAGGLAISDRLWASWAQTQAPALAALAPALGAAFVYLHAVFVPRPARPSRVAAPRPAPRAAPPKPAPPLAPAPVLKPTPGLEPAPATGIEGRVMVVGFLVLALIAGGFLVLVTYYGGLE